MDTLSKNLLLTTMAGLAIPIEAIFARFENIRSKWLEEEFRHTVIAFGGGVLISAVALVLVPDGVERLPSGAGIISAFVLGGIVFYGLDRLLARAKGAMTQLVAMLSDFIPEARRGLCRRRECRAPSSVAHHLAELARRLQCLSGDYRQRKFKKPREDHRNVLPPGSPGSHRRVYRSRMAFPVSVRRRFHHAFRSKWHPLPHVSGPCSPGTIEKPESAGSRCRSRLFARAAWPADDSLNRVSLHKTESEWC